MDRVQIPLWLDCRRPGGPNTRCGAVPLTSCHVLDVKEVVPCGTLHRMELSVDMREVDRSDGATAGRGMP